MPQYLLQQGVRCSVLTTIGMFTRFYCVLTPQSVAVRMMVGHVESRGVPVGGDGFGGLLCRFLQHEAPCTAISMVQWTMNRMRFITIHLLSWLPRKCLIYNTVFISSIGKCLVSADFFPTNVRSTHCFFSIMPIHRLPKKWMYF